MAITQLKADTVAAFDTSPITKIKSAQNQTAFAEINKLTVLTTALTDVGSTIMLAPIRSNAMVNSIKLFNQSLAASGLAVNIGLYNGAQIFKRADGVMIQPYALLSASCFSAGSTALIAASTTGNEVYAGASVDNFGKRLWELAGLVQDSDNYLIITATVSVIATTPTAGIVSAVVQFAL